MLGVYLKILSWEGKLVIPDGWNSRAGIHFPKCALSSSGSPLALGALSDHMFHVIDKKSLRIQKLEHVLVAQMGSSERNMLWRVGDDKRAVPQTDP